MKILFLSKSHPDLFPAVLNGSGTGLSWINATIDELTKRESMSIALALPANTTKLVKSENKGFILYGLPSGVKKNAFIKTFENLIQKPENNDIKQYVSQTIEDFKPDVIQVFGSENSFGLFVQHKNIPVLLYIQGFLTIVQKKWFSGITKWEQFRFARLKDFLRRYGEFNEYYTVKKRAVREREIIRNCKYFIGRTDFDRRIVSLLSPESKYFHCEEFIRTEFFRAKWDQHLDGTVKCVSILKGTSYKGIELLIETLLVLRKHSSFSFELYICGVSEDEEIVSIIRKKYRKVYKLLNINFLGKLDANRIISLLCSSNFYIHPSHVENSSNSVCEAMIIGMPIIATNVGGITALIKDKIEGILVQEGEPFSLAGAISELVNNYDYARLLGKNARERSVLRHNPNAIAERLSDIYNKILLENGR